MSEDTELAVNLANVAILPLRGHYEDDLLIYSLADAAGIVFG